MDLMASFNEIIRTRRSIRKFSGGPIENDVLKALVEAATFAPSGCDYQNWQFIAIKSKQNIEPLAEAVEKGGDRQELHEKIRTYSMIAGKHVKEEGLENDLCDMILKDPAFMITKEKMDEIMSPENFIGRCPQQVDEFLENCIYPVLEANKDVLGEGYEMKN